MTQLVTPWHTGHNYIYLDNLLRKEFQTQGSRRWHNNNAVAHVTSIQEAPYCISSNFLLCANYLPFANGSLQEPSAFQVLDRGEMADRCILDMINSLKFLENKFYTWKTPTFPGWNSLTPLRRSLEEGLALTEIMNYIFYTPQPPTSYIHPEASSEKISRDPYDAIKDVIRDIKEKEAIAFAAFIAQRPNVNHYVFFEIKRIDKNLYEITIINTGHGIIPKRPTPKTSRDTENSINKIDKILLDCFPHLSKKNGQVTLEGIERKSLLDNLKNLIDLLISTMDKKRSPATTNGFPFAIAKTIGVKTIKLNEIWAQKYDICSMASLLRWTELRIFDLMPTEPTLQVHRTKKLFYRIYGTLLDIHSHKLMHPANAQDQIDLLNHIQEIINEAGAANPLIQPLPTPKELSEKLANDSLRMLLIIHLLEKEASLLDHPCDNKINFETALNLSPKSLPSFINTMQKLLESSGR